MNKTGWYGVGLWFVVLAAGGCSGPAGSLELEASPRTINVSSGTIAIVVHATTATGLIGSGMVKVTSSVGSARAGLTGTLDDYGSFRASVTCAPSQDPECNTSPSMELTASWVSNGKTVTADASVKLLASTATETNCANAKDDDLDGLSDCDDPDCEGVRCLATDLCVTGSTCSQKHCVGGTPIDCSAIPSTDCKAPSGACDPSLGCAFVPKNVGLPCDDHSVCTSRDQCDSTGKCVGAPITCPPSRDLCHEDGVCDPQTGCSNPPVRDGTSCASRADGRCCSGTCVVISQDARNCGGCGVVCGGSCVDASTISCSIPALTTGFCQCAGACPRRTACVDAYTLCIPTSCGPFESIAGSACQNAPYCHY